jgi:16S rRNA G966 N2-methylase RsmD
LLDVGGGLGILSLELVDAGFSQATVVDASSAYLAAASEEATRRDRSTSTEFVHGDFVVMASRLTPASVVALDLASRRLSALARQCGLNAALP